MSACSKIVVKEREILSILRDFLEETERVECLVAFEKCTGSYPRHLSQELASLREIVLCGNLDELQKNLSDLFQDRGDVRKLQRCKYELAKQQYLEMLQTLSKETADALKQKLLEVEELCPSSEEFEVLLSLLSLPSIDDSPEYRGWTIPGGRLKCFYLLVDWLTEGGGRQTKTSSSSSSASHHSNSLGHTLSESRLVQLLTKGLLYEQCEAVCAHSQSEGKEKTATTILDLYNWIKQQPDSAFQLSPSSLQLDIRAELREGSAGSDACASSHVKLIKSDSESQEEASHTPDHDHSSAIENIDQSSAVGDDESKHGQQDSDIGDQTDGCNEQASAEQSSRTRSSEQSNPEQSTSAENGALREQASITSQQPMGQWLPKELLKFDDNFVDGPSHKVNEGGSLAPSRSEVGLAQTEKIEIIPPSKSEPALLMKSEDNHVAAATHSIKEEAGPNASRSESALSQRDKVQNKDAPTSSTSMPALPVDKVKPLPHLDVRTTTVNDQPEVRTLKKGRKSSTPKPKHIVQPPSPCTSPVPHIPAIHIDPVEHGLSSKAKRQINFVENENDDSIVFPSAKLLAHVKDKQV